MADTNDIRIRAAVTRATVIVAIAAIAAIAGIALQPHAIPTGSREPTSSAQASGVAGLPPTVEPSIGPSASQLPTFATASPGPLPTCPPETERFPAGYTSNHTYAGLCRALVAAETAHPDIARLFAIGTSWQGRSIWAMEITSHLTDGTHPPGVLFDGLHHGLEHLSLEMTLGIMGWLLDGYGTDPTITGLVRTRAIFIVFDVNPDGAAYDISGGRFHEWRKNRQPGPGGAVGTDLNRNYADHWGCCGLVSAVPSNPYFRGVAPFSAPETVAVRDFVQGLVFDGRQEIRTAISFHASGRLVLWPYGYTRTPVPPDMTADDHAVFVALGRKMGSLNGYLPEQATGLYVDSGTENDWAYGIEHIFAFTFELGLGTYQPNGAIRPEIARNRAAVLYLIAMADCPYRAIGKSSQYCGST
jgi:carboxypeptidase T